MDLQSPDRLPQERGRLDEGLPVLLRETLQEGYHRLEPLGAMTSSSLRSSLMTISVRALARARSTWS